MNFLFVSILLTKVTFQCFFLLLPPFFFNINLVQLFLNSSFYSSCLRLLLRTPHFPHSQADIPKLLHPLCNGGGALGNCCPPIRLLSPVPCCYSFVLLEIHHFPFGLNPRFAAVCSSSPSSVFAGDISPFGRRLELRRYSDSSSRWF